RASRAEQIAIAEKVLDRQGWGAWPACSRKLGLTRADASGSSVSRSTTRTAITKKKATKKVTKRSSRTAAKKRATSTAAYGSYVVRAGDSLSAIAHRKHVRGGWQALYQANKGSIGSNPNLIRVGQRLRLPH
ncbi:MAG TPA: transglycosylase family protein, partial [Actinomycetales bacterium]|nr:transglycosylase family protein [Actinomycetales bacterium]